MVNLSMTALDTREHERVCPTACDGSDDRFTTGLLFDVADVLERHGYPRPAGMDYVELQETLFTFLYSGDGSSDGVER